MKKFYAEDKTALLVHAMENADNLEDIVILWRDKDGNEGFWTVGSQTVERFNWFLDRMKLFILGDSK